MRKDVCRSLKDIFAPMKDVFKSFKDVFARMKDVFKAFKDVSAPRKDLSKGSIRCGAWFTTPFTVDGVVNHIVQNFFRIPGIGLASRVGRSHNFGKRRGPNASAGGE
jgi:hypothetical protein